MLGFTVAAASVMFALRMSIFPSNALRGLRKRGESCAKAVKLSAIATAKAARVLRHKSTPNGGPETPAFAFSSAH